MKMEKYALLDTDFISKTHFIQGNTEKSLSDLVVEMPGYCFFCHSQIIKELSRHNQQAIGWLQHKISEQKIQCYAESSLQTGVGRNISGSLCGITKWFLEIQGYLKTKKCKSHHRLTQ